MLGKPTDYRHTVAKPFSLAGVGLHTGKAAVVTVTPADSGKGLSFVRSDMPEGNPIPATLDHVASSERCTTLACDGMSVSTVEHLLAALYASQIDDAIIIVDGEELPLLDGSARPFVNGINGVGLARQEMARSTLMLERAVSLRVGEATYEVTPSAQTTLTVTIAFDHPLIGEQTITCGLSAGEFESEIASARTFGFEHEAGALRARNLIGGVTPDSVLVLTESNLRTGQRLRWPDEFVRHKALDVVGDLALLGAPVQCDIRATRPGHAGNVALGRAIAAHAILHTESSYTPV